jgi:hypothetical protein
MQIHTYQLRKSSPEHPEKKPDWLKDPLIFQQDKKQDKNIATSGAEINLKLN